jgi:hypothetical protein
MGLNSLETDYFLKLVQIDRAASESLRLVFRRHLEEIKSRASEIKNRVPESAELNEQDRAIYYSSWQLSLVRLLTSIRDFQTVAAISSHTRLTESRVREILEFLTSRGLCAERPDGSIFRTEKNTHVEARSPLAVRHHQNWRVKAMELQERMTSDDLAFTSPISLSENDRLKVRELLLEAIAEIGKIVEKSPAEKVAFLGIDWLKI